jgi:hypothetical protein
VLSLVCPDGLAVIVVAGGVVSGGVVSGGVVSGGGGIVTVKARLAGLVSMLPAASVARTSKVCGPSASAAVVWGEEQTAKGWLSTRHSKVAPEGSL